MEDQINKAIEVFKAGGIIIFPTDTAFGIGCRVDDKKAVERLFKIRKRSLDKAVPVLVNSVEMTKYYTELVSDDVLHLMTTYWPGALTVVLKANIKNVLPLVRGGGETIGVRMPNHNNILSIIGRLGVPILGPSANFAGLKTPFSSNALDKNLVQLVDYVMPGQARGKAPSTVIDCSIKPWKILRQGAINISL